MPAVPPGSNIAPAGIASAESWGTASVFAAPPPEVDIRMYNASGQRMALPSDWVKGIDFQIGEEGGYLEGTLRVQSPYGGAFQTYEVERVDVRLWGQLLYRGFVRISQSDTTGDDQTDSPTLYGMIEKLNGYLVRRAYAYAVAVGPDVVFTDLVNEYVKRSGRQPNIEIDVGGVGALGLSIMQFDASGKSFPQAMNDLLALFPEKLIWGCDVDPATLTDRIYLRPRATAVKYKFAVGNNVRQLLYPRDATQVVNTLLVTGAQLGATTAYPPNLAPNGSFETPVIPGELTSNLLQNSDFSVASGANPGTPWQWRGDPTLDGTYARTGSGAACVFDNNPFAGETIWQDVAITYPLPAHAAVWLMTNPGENWQLRLRMEYRNAGGVVDSIIGPWITPPADGVWRHYRLDWPTPNGAGATTLRYYVEQNGSVSTGSHGCSADNTAMWVAQVQADGWIQGTGSGGAFSALDWNNHDNSLTPYDGGAMVKLTAAITGGAGSYGQIQTAQSKRIAVQTHAAYYLQAWIYVPSGTMDVALGGVVWNGGSATGTLVGATHTIAAGTWTQVQYIVNTGSPADGLDILLRFYTANTCYVDAVACFFNGLPDFNNQGIYYPGSAYTAKRSVTDYASSLSTDAANSITNFGPREKAVSNSNILTVSDLDAFCKLYLQAHATSAISAGLAIFGPTAPVFLDGQVKLENLPASPPALAPSNLRYQIDENGIELTIDLDNKRPDLALLLREIQEGKQ